MTDPPYTGPKIEAQESLDSYVVGVPRGPELDDRGEEALLYGSRWVEVEDAEGAARFEEVPLRWNDLFDPQEGDRLVHSPEHGKTLRDTGARLDCLYDARGRDDVVVYDDVRIDWKTPGVDPACPDVAVIPRMKKPKSGSFEKPSLPPASTIPISRLSLNSLKMMTLDLSAWST